ncbi:MAG TPA: PD-(D/E)XK nuclease family protein [Vicinamibacteria bacterium]|nr:PD-(D/E)XK nuclease family protein [Vicinamibacteria bacterium]
MEAPGSDVVPLVATAEVPEPARSGFSWSISRHDTFQSCRRRYFYAYYVAPEDPEVRRLKRLSALPLWAGSVVHETIEELLKAREKMPSETEQEAIVRAAVHSRMLGDWRASEAASPDFRLFEHEYGTPVEAEDKKIVVGIVMRSLRNLFRSQALQEAFAVGRSQWLTVEDLASFHVGDVEVLLRMDLAFRDREGRVVIVDWKTGRNEGRFSEVQLAGYALYAAERGWVASPEELRTELAYLAVPRYVRRTVDSRKLEHARRFIAKSAGTMKSLLLDPLANRGRLEDFPMIDRPRTCRRCNFRKLCFPRAEAQPGPDAAVATP